MKINEIVSLVAKGYNPTQIKEISEKAKTNPDIITLAANSDSYENFTALCELVGTDQGEKDPDGQPPEDTHEGDGTTPENNDNGDDAQKKIKELEEQLKAAQDANRSKDVSGKEQPTDEDIIKDLVLSCY